MDPPDDSTTGPVPDRGPVLIGIIWSLTTLALITALLRAYARTHIRRFGWDDGFMVLAAACFLAWSIVLTLYARRGGVTHIGDLSKTGLDNVANVLFLNWLAQVFGIIGVAAGKISVAALLLTIIKTTGLKWQRVFLWTVPVALAGVIAVACSTLTFAQCSPAERLWDKRVKGTCIDPHVMSGFGTFTGAFNTFADASLAIIPATIFWQLNSSTADKVQLTIVFGLNILTSICSGIKTQYLVELSNRTDQTWATYNIFVWVTAELFLMIVCGTIPTLHIVLVWGRAVIAHIPRKIVFVYKSSAHGSSSSNSRRSRSKKLRSDGSGDTDTELSRMTHMHITTRTTVERGHVSRSESVDQLVDEKGVPENGVRVDMMYDVRRDTRPNSECSKTSL